MKYIKRRYLVSFIIVLAVALLAPAAAYAEAESLSIDTAVELAQAKNPQVTSLKLQVDRANILRDDAADAVTFFSPKQLLVNPDGQMLVNNYEQLTIQLKTLKKQLEAEQRRVEKEVVNAYAGAVIAANDMKATRLTMEEMKQQACLYDLGQNIGVVSLYDHNTVLRGMEQLEDKLAMQEKQYDTSIAALRGLLHKGTEWEPVLTSQPVITKYPRQSLATEFIRATEQSALILGAQTAVELERIKVYWPQFIGKDAYMDEIQRNVKELEYEKTKRDMRSTVEQLYWGMDALEAQIGLSQKLLEEKQRELNLKELKYELGLIPLRSMLPRAETLETARNDVTRAQIDYNSLQAKLAANKANYGYITGQTVYSKLDWK